MAKAVQPRAIQTLSGGRIAVSYTYGTPPIGTPATGEIIYENSDALKASIGQLEDRLGEEGLLLIHLAITYLSQAGTFNNPNQVTNKALTFDPFAAQPWRIS